MKIIQLVDFHSENMGYSDVCLPKSFTKLGHKTVVITSTSNVYFNSKNYDNIFKNFHKKQYQGTYEADGYKLIRLKQINTPLGIYLVGLFKTLKNIKPDIVQCGELNSLTTFQAAVYNIILNFKLTVECHIHKSVFEIKKKHKFKTKIKKNLKNIISYFFLKIISFKIIRCYPISKDSYDICKNYFSINKKKLKIISLGSDTNIYYKFNKKPINEKLKLGFSKNDKVCIYTGRITEEKGPHLLLEAINLINVNNKIKVKGLFIGDGPKKYVDKFYKSDNIILLPFMNYKDLNLYYNIADIGVWPKQESTSQLDALSSGLPIIINNNSGVKERAYESGLLYIEDSVDDLANKLTKLFEKKLNEKYSSNAINKIKNNYSWHKIAKQFEADYIDFLEK